MAVAPICDVIFGEQEPAISSTLNAGWSSFGPGRDPSHTLYQAAMPTALGESIAYFLYGVGLPGTNFKEVSPGNSELTNNDIRGLSRLELVKIIGPALHHALTLW